MDLDDSSPLKITSKVNINTSPDKVFYWLSDPNRAMKWMTSVTETEILTETPGRVGTTFRETVEDKEGRIEIFGTITEYKQNETLTFHLTSKIHSVDARYCLDESKGITHLTFTAEIRFDSTLRILSQNKWPELKKKIADQSQKEFLELKKLCEQED